MTTALSLSTLATLPAGVSAPGYDRGSLTPGILHIGVGNFHRAHMAVYLDRLFATGESLDWAIVGAGIKPFDAARRALLAAQDWLTTVVELDPEGLSARVTGAMIDFCEVSPDAILARMADPAIRIVSLTITEGGYFVDARTGSFDARHPDIAADAATPDAPRTVFGLLVAGLKARRDAAAMPFTVLSCDNLPDNGDVTRAAVTGLARLSDPELARWIEAEVSFPNSMVDCITPGTSPREIDLVRDRFGIEDAAPVACEPFRQWVMEDAFPAGRPALEKVGVQFVDDVAPYETMKLRILNAGHAAIAYPAALLGHRFVHDAMADADIAAWLATLMRREVIPVLPPIPGTDFDAYLATCITRFANPEVGDTILRLCIDGSNRQPKFVLPTIREALKARREIELLALEIAFWAEWCAKGAPLQDDRAEALRAAARDADPTAFLALTDVFGDLGEDPALAAAFGRHLTALRAGDLREVLRAAIV